VGTLLMICTSKIRWNVTTESAFVCTKLLQLYCNCIHRRIVFHSKEAVCVCINTPLNIAYLTKPAHCDIEATMKSYILKLDKFSISAAFLYDDMY
jgi:hypothetical protein